MKRSPKLYYNFQRWTVYLQRQHDLLKSIYGDGHSNTSASKNTGHPSLCLLSSSHNSRSTAQGSATASHVSLSPCILALHTTGSTARDLGYLRQRRVARATSDGSSWLRLPPAVVRGTGAPPAAAHGPGSPLATSTAWEFISTTPTVRSIEEGTGSGKHGQIHSSPHSTHPRPSHFSAELLEGTGGV